MRCFLQGKSELRFGTAWMKKLEPGKRFLGAISAGRGHDKASRVVDLPPIAVPLQSNIIT